MCLLTKIKFILNYYIKSNLHVALCLVFYTVLIYYQNDITVNYYEILFIFLATLFAYNFIKYHKLPLAKNRPNYVLYQLFILVAVISLIILSFKVVRISILKTIIVLIASLLVIAYSFPAYKINSLRNYPLVKILTISAAWTLTSVCFSFIGILKPKILVFYCLSIFLMVSCQMISFEIRDEDIDKNKSKTVVHVFGLQRIKTIGYAILITLSVVIFFISLIEKDSVSYLSNIIILIVLFYLIFKSNKNQTEYFSSIFVESVPIYWLIIEFLVKFFF